MRGTTDPGSRAADVLLGLGGTVDLEIVWDAEVFSELASQFRLTADELVAPARLSTERDVLRAILSHVVTGSGGEYFVDSALALGDFTDRFDSVVTLGGTPVRAALAMDRIGVPSTVHLVSIDDNVRSLLPPSVEVVSSADHDSFDPHVIVQFPAGAVIRIDGEDFATRHPNRVILSNDVPNQRLAISEGLGDAIEHARVAMVSGFNSMQDGALLDSRLVDVARHLGRAEDSALTWYEHSGFHVPAFSERVREAIGPLVHIWSCNEDELSTHLGHPIDLLDAGAVLDAVRRMHHDVGALTVIVHSRHWAMALGGDHSVREAAVRGGVASASARYAFGDGVDRAGLAKVVDWPRQPEALVFADQLGRISGSNVTVEPAYLIPAASPTTIGLGDTFVGGALAALLALRS